MKFFIANAFTQALFTGNPAGVVFLGSTPFPADSIMQKTAAELRYSETAFIQKGKDGSFTTRYFTPVGEVDLCGHATIGGFGALAQVGLVPKGECLNHTLAGTLSLTIGTAQVIMAMATPKTLHTFTTAETAALRTAMGISQEQLAPGLTPETITTGLPDILLPLQSVQALNTMQPNMPALAALSKAHGSIGVHAFAFDEHGTPHCRNFAPLYGIDEEAATGTANGALLWYLHTHALLAEGWLTILQGEAMGRPSEIQGLLHITPEGPTIHIGGAAAILAEGEIHL